jgi:hypothetical protein
MNFSMPRRVALLFVILSGMLIESDLNGPFVAHGQEAAESSDEPEAVVKETDPVVLAYRELSPVTLDQLTRALQAMYRIRRPDEARNYLAKIESLNSEPGQLANLARQFGGRLFISLTTDPDYVPEGRDFAQKVLGAFQSERTDAARLADFAARRAAGEKGALAPLVEAGEHAIPAILVEIKKATEPATQARLIVTLIKIGPVCFGPLTAAVRSGSDPIVAAAALTLAKLGDARAAKHLVRPSFDESLSTSTRDTALKAMAKLLNRTDITRKDAERFLAKKALAAYRGDAGREIGEYGNQWIWDARVDGVRDLAMPATVGSRLLAAALASDLAALRPDDQLVQHLAWSARLEAAKAQVEPGSPLIIADTSLYAEAQRVPVDRLLKVLQYSIDHDHAMAATAVCELLSQSGPHLLAIDGGMKPIVAATRHPNRRLQYAACRAIMATTDGDSQFSGNSRWLDRLGFFISSQGRQKAIIAHPVPERGRTLAGLFNDMGIYTTVVTSGSDLVAAVIEDPDIEMIFMHQRLYRPVMPETLQLIRGDYRIQSVPVALLMEGVNDRACERLASSDPLTIAVQLPVDLDYASTVVQRLIPLAEGSIPSSAERQRQAIMAIGWLRAQSSEPANYWQLEQLQRQISAALVNSHLAVDAAALLGRLANTRSQETLLRQLNTESNSIAIRTAALDAFIVTVESRGILLGHTEIRQQMNLSKSHRDDSIIQEAFATIVERLSKNRK